MGKGSRTVSLNFQPNWLRNLEGQTEIMNISGSVWAARARFAVPGITCLKFKFITIYIT